MCTQKHTDNTEFLLEIVHVAIKGQRCSYLCGVLKHTHHSHKGTNHFTRGQYEINITILIGIFF